MNPRIGIIGHGALGRSVARILSDSGRCELTAILVPSPRDEAPGIRFVHTLADFLSVQHDVVVECAGQSALREYAVPVLAAGIDLVPASVGVFADDAWRRAVVRAMRDAAATVRIPSGAMVGIDGLAAAKATGVDQVLYRGTMSPSAIRNLEAAAAITGRTLVFSGTAREAVSRFPKNANLTATIALASIGFDRTRVELFVDPGVTNNIHELEAVGAFGEFHVKVIGRRISEASPSSRIVPGSLAQAALGSNYSLLPDD